jgi:iron-sulfur cluster assembly protein
MITVTDSAKKQAIRLMEDEGQDGYFIRVGVEGGGCSGLMYQLEFDNKETDIGFFRRIERQRVCLCKS